MPQHDKLIYVDGIEQPVFYYLLPKSRNENLIVNLPRAIFENVAAWIDEKTAKRLIIEDCGVRHTLYDAVVVVDNIGINRYGTNSHTLTISCTNMVRGVFKENK